MCRHTEGEISIEIDNHSIEMQVFDAFSIPTSLNNWHRRQHLVEQLSYIASNVLRLQTKKTRTAFIGKGATIHFLDHHITQIFESVVGASRVT